MTLKALIASDVDDVFMNIDEFAENVFYLNTAHPNIIVTGIAFSVVYTTETNEGLKEIVNSLDWLVPLDDFVSTVSAFKPRSGDVIRRNVGSDVHVYEVFPIDDDIPAVELDDRNLMYRLHTKLVRIEEG